MIDIDRRRVLRPVLGWALTVGGILTAALSYAGLAEGYLILRPFTHTLLPLVLAPVALAAGAGFLVGHRLVRVCLQWILGLGAAVGACLAAIVAFAIDDPVEHSVVATSEEFRLVG